MAKVEQIDLPLGALNTFVQQGVPDSTLAKGLQTFGTMALDARKGALEAEASGEAKNLLQRFQGKEVVGLQRQQSAAEVEKGAAAALLADKESGLPTEAQETLGKHIGDIAELQENLAKRQEAVLAGIMSNSDFRLQAEKLYYQVLAKSPGLKDEIAAAMSEYISFDPRGQTAKLRMDALNDTNAADAARAKAAQKDRDENRKMLKDAGLWNKDWTYDQNVNTYLDWQQQETRSNKKTEFLKNVRARGEILDVAQQETLRNEHLADLKAAGGAHSKFSTVIQDKAGNVINVAMWSPSQVLAENSETKAALLQSYALKRDAAIEELEMWASETSKAQGKDSFQPYIDAINREFETITRILQGKDVSEIEEELKKVWENRNAVILATKTHEIMLGHPDIQTLSALNNLIDPDLLAQATAFSLGTQVLTDILLNKAGTIPEELSEKEHDNLGLPLNKLRDTYKRGAELSDPEVRASGNLLLSLVNAEVSDEGKSLANKHRIAETLANKKYMEHLERVSPSKYEKILKRARPVLQEMGQFTAGVVQREWKSKAEEFPEAAPTFNPKNYHLEFKGGVIEVVPNTGVVDNLDADRVIDAQNSFNNSSRRLMKNMVSAYMELFDTSPQQASVWVSRELGFSPKDIVQAHTASPDQRFISTDFGEDVTSEPLIDDSTSSPKEEKKTEEEQEETVEEKTERLLNESLSSSLQTFKQNLASAVNNGASPSDILAIANDLQIGDTTSV